MTRHIIAGTAGHIDHGKTALIRALTGIETDRLKEEQERGITIELGFAHLTLPSGTLVGIVDVPGHEKFVRHMVAGAAGMDLVMLVIAADEGIMPQTREHLDICRMLDIRRGFIVLTKKDLVDEEWLEMLRDEVRTFVKGTFLEGSPLVAVSSVTKEGVPELIATLEAQAQAVDPKPPWGAFRLPVDRVFTMKGFGTVVTGTSLSGRLSVGDPVRVYPGDLETRVRGLQVHGETVETAEAGYRTAINLQGVDRDAVRRGDVVAPPGQLTPSYIMDLRLHLLPSAPRDLKNRTRVRFHLGTAEILGRVRLLEGDTLEPGKSAFVQIRLEEPTTALARDRFVIRSYSPSYTIAGGSVIDPAAGKQRRKGAAILERLRSLEKGSPTEAILAALLAKSSAGATAVTLAANVNLDEQTVAAALAELLAQGAAHRITEDKHPLYIHHRVLREVEDNVLALLDAFHQAQPLKPGLPREEIKSKLPREANAKLLPFLIEHLTAAASIAVSPDGKTVRRAEFRVRLDEKQARIRTRIEETLRAAGLAVPSPGELAADLKVNQPMIVSLLEVMEGEGEVIKIHEDIRILRRHWDALVARIEAHFAQNPELTVSDFKELTALTRKHTIPILEFIDRSGLTLRVGDKRVARKK